MIVGVVVVALFLFAAFIPWIRSWWFDWLGGLTHSWQTGQLARGWLVVAAFILLPAFDYSSGSSRCVCAGHEPSGKVTFRLRNVDDAGRPSRQRELPAFGMQTRLGTEEHVA